MIKRVLFVLVLTVSAASRALPTATIDETSEEAVTIVDDRSLTHGESKRLLRVRGNKTDILDEERVGSPPRQIGPIEKILSAVSAPQVKTLSLFEPELRDPPSMESLVAEWGLEIEEIAQSLSVLENDEELNVQYHGKLDNMAIGDVYHGTERLFLEGKVAASYGAILEEALAQYQEKFKDAGVDFNQVGFLARYMYRYEPSKPDISVIVEMALGRVVLSKWRSEHLPAVMP
ncbi:hypothetical protein PsorP6_003119 [Peronosclerospora sorghi]|uniref:Uncharacterized protein n=1 Tax=Peronosclerospora sorghi TaxID=230839 RepID=A0ACC0VSJ1_9STRA|nr:hypothetical protein PsorP6_003119 [Peronosclerospora sorghi]